MPQADARLLNKSDFEILADFRYQIRKFVRFSEQVARQHGIKPLQYLLLLHVKGYKGREWATIGELAERLQTHHNGVVALASRCEKLGLLYRQRGIVDRREVEIYLTPEGNKLVKEIASAHRSELLSLQGIFKIPGAKELGAES